MPNRNLTDNDTIETIIYWLDDHLNHPVQARIDCLQDIENSRGIYFWFMKELGYEYLWEHLVNDEISRKYQKVIEGEKYDLVYLGTAGTNRKEKNTLRQRLKWHLDNRHNNSTICHGTLSTLRQTVGSILSNDLILPNTEVLVDEFFLKNFYLYVIPYDEQENTRVDINNDEFCLISKLKPLFNIKNNPHARKSSIPNTTRNLKEKRESVIHATRLRIGCVNGNTRGGQDILADNSLPPTSPQSNYKLVYENGDCMEFTVKREESVQKIISGIYGLPMGKCEIEIFNSVNPREFLYQSKKNNRKRTTGNKRINIYDYFSNPDTNMNNQPRWKIVQQEMIDKGIDEITVRVVSFVEKPESKIESSSMEITSIGKDEVNSDNVQINSNDYSELIKKLEKIEHDEPVLLILGCSDSKISGGTFAQTSSYFNSKCIINKRAQSLNNYNQLLLNEPSYFYKRRNNIQLDSQYFTNCQNSVMRALDRYGDNHSIFFNPSLKSCYYQKINSGKLHLLILSGLYGVLKWDDLIIDYHFELNKSSLYILDNCILNEIEKYISNYNIKNENVYYSLSKKYSKIINEKPRNWNSINKEKGDKHGRTAAKFIENVFLPNL
jgi:cytoplasmic iron level regulating protein YaaA (DUF328/UPF0246 family)